jgi:hypothetical protein
MVIDKPTQERPPVIGPRLRAELERRVRELQGRAKPTPREMRELAQLKEFLRITPRGNDSETAESALDRSRPSLTMLASGEISMADDDLITRAEPRNKGEKPQ